ncbi:MAG TPA: c-type cytochrome domain-containing protein [Lysobacter sp.]|nr:c-type cytochrome domain-containing protein [Lysobacter sp.]
MNSKTALLAAALALSLPSASDGASQAPLPQQLHDTGLYARSAPQQVAPGVLGYTPQYPLWSDGASKRRWIALPRGRAIDATRPERWEFPRGTRLWKEFAVDGRAVETRLIERLGDGSWRYATYIWDEAGAEARLAPEAGTTLTLPSGKPYRILSEADCRACHDGAPVPVLGFNTLQLSADRDPLAPHAEPLRDGDVDLRVLASRGLLRGLPKAMLDTPPRIAAASPAERAVLGYLNANCGHCHASPEATGAAVPVELQLALDPADIAAGEKMLGALVGGSTRYRPAGVASTRLLVPGDPAASVLLLRMRSRDPRMQMPPLGTEVPDKDALALIERWVEHDLPNRKETPR